MGLELNNVGMGIIQHIGIVCGRIGHDRYIRKERRDYQKAAGVILQSGQQDPFMGYGL